MPRLGEAVALGNSGALHLVTGDVTHDAQRSHCVFTFKDRRRRHRANSRCATCTDIAYLQRSALPGERVSQQLVNSLLVGPVEYGRARLPDQSIARHSGGRQQRLIHRRKPTVGIDRKDGVTRRLEEALVSAFRSRQCICRGPLIGDIAQAGHRARLQPHFEQRRGADGDAPTRAIGTHHVALVLLLRRLRLHALTDRDPLR